MLWFNIITEKYTLKILCQSLCWRVIGYTSEYLWKSYARREIATLHVKERHFIVKNTLLFMLCFDKRIWYSTRLRDFHSSIWPSLFETFDDLGLSSLLETLEEIGNFSAPLQHMFQNMTEVKLTFNGNVNFYTMATYEFDWNVNINNTIQFTSINYFIFMLCSAAFLIHAVYNSNTYIYMYKLCFLLLEDLDIVPCNNTGLRWNKHRIFRSHYSTGRYCMLLHRVLQWLKKSIHEILSQKNTSHTLSSSFSYGSVKIRTICHARKLAQSCKHLHLQCLPDPWNLPDTA